MRNVVILIAAAAVGTLAATSSFAGMNDERVEKRDEIWSQEALEKSDWQMKSPDAYSSEDILPERQDRHRVMG